MSGYLKDSHLLVFYSQDSSHQMPYGKYHSCHHWPPNAKWLLQSTCEHKNDKMLCHVRGGEFENLGLMHHSISAQPTLFLLLPRPRKLAFAQVLISKVWHSRWHPDAASDSIRMPYISLLILTFLNRCISIETNLINTNLGNLRHFGNNVFTNTTKKCSE